MVIQLPCGIIVLLYLVNMALQPFSQLSNLRKSPSTVGGCNESQEYCNDVHIFDIETSTWIQPELKDVVPARYLHSAVVYDNKLFIYGGFAKNPECKEKKRG